jgi:uncharacterized protein (TIRG00374 family)
VSAPLPDATLPPRPRVLSPGRILALVVALISLYIVWPSIVAVFGSFDELRQVNPVWFVVMAALEGASFVCIWSLIALCMRSKRYFLIGSSQLVGNSISRTLPGGAAVGAATQYRLLVGAGLQPTQVATGLTAVSVINTATLFALPVLSLPAILGGAAVDRGLARAAWLGVGVFVLLVGGGAVLLLADRPIDWIARTIERIHNALLRRRPPMHDLAGRLTQSRDMVRQTLDEDWASAILRSVGNVLFDYLALLAALVASGAKPNASLTLLAYVVAAVLGTIPITPGGLGFVEAGLTGTLVLAGVPGAQATLATLAYRLVSYWLPIAAGPVAYGLYRRRAVAWHARAAEGGRP